MKCKKAKWLSEEALHIAQERSETKGKGEKERYTHLNGEFQRREKRGKKAFFSELAKKQRKRIQWETGELFKKIKDSKGIFHAKMGTIKDRNGMDLTKVEDVKKTWQEYTDNHTKKISMTQITMMV